MSNTASLPRARLDANPRDVLAVLPAIGRLMVTARHLGATHERIGAVETVSFEHGWAVIGGAEHESRIELSSVAEIVIDRTSVMKDKAYPRLDLHRADGSYICGIVGFDGLAPFDAAVAAFGPGTAVEPKPEAPPPTAPMPARPTPAACRSRTRRPPPFRWSSASAAPASSSSGVAPSRR